MAARKTLRPIRQQRRTALLVGEGLAEQAFLQHLKNLYVTRGQKQITIKTAKGKGGAHVLDYTRRQTQQAAYDQLGALLDTDTDWTNTERAQAKAWGIEVIESHPCLEALLLRIAGHRVPASTAQCKKAFERQFRAQAHQTGLYEHHFPKTLLDRACLRVTALQNLLDFLSR